MASRDIFKAFEKSLYNVKKISGLTTKFFSSLSKELNHKNVSVYCKTNRNSHLTINKALQHVTANQIEATNLQRRHNGITEERVIAENPESQISRCPFHGLAKKQRRKSQVFTRQEEKEFFFFKIQKRRNSISATTYNVNLVEGLSVDLQIRVKQLMHSVKALSQNFAKYLLNVSSKVQTYENIPGPRGLPFLGSVLDYTFLGPFTPRNFHHALKSRHSTYGKIFREKFLNEEFVYISDPSDLRIVIQNEGKEPCRPALDAIVQSRQQEGLDVGITALQGKEWSRLRTAINSVIMKPGAVVKFRHAQHDVTKDLISFIKNYKDTETGEVEDFEVWLNRWALESIGVILLDTRLGLIRPTKSGSTDPLAERLRKCMDVFFDYGARLTFNAPTWKIWNTKDWKIYRKCQKDEFEAAGTYVDRKLEQLKKGGFADDGKTKSFLESLIKESNLKRDESTTLCLELLAGGIDTTANAVVFTLYELARNQDQQNILRELIKEDEYLDDETVGKLTSKSARFLRACVWEALRLHPLTYVNMRKTNKDLVLSGFNVPSGTTVRYTTHLMHLENEEYFKEPKSFKPERWNNRTSEYRCTQQFVFTPFGHGARQCPGRRIAEQELDLLIRDIIKTFRVKYHHEDIGTKVRLFNAPDKRAKFDFQLI